MLSRLCLSTSSLQRWSIVCTTQMLNPFVTSISIVVTVNIMSLQSHGHDTVYRYGMWLVSKTGLLTMAYNVTF